LPLWSLRNDGCDSSFSRLQDTEFSADSHPADDIQRLADHFVDDGVIVLAKGLGDPIGDDRAYAEALVAQELAEAVDPRRFHLEIGDTVGAIGEIGEAVDELGLGEAEAQHAALGTIEAGAGDGDAVVEAAGEVSQQGGAGAADIGLRQAVVQLGLGGEGMEELAFLFGGFVAVEIEEVVDAEAVGRGYEAVDVDIFLQSAAGAHADDREGGEGLFDGTGGKVDISKSIELVEDDVDVVGADAGGDHGEPLFADAAGVGDEFPMVGAMFDGVEMFADPIHPIRIPYGENGGGQFFGAEIEMIDSAAAVDN